MGRIYPARQAPVAAFVLSLIGGVMILAGGSIMAAFAPFAYYGTMEGYYGLARGPASGAWLHAGAAVAIVSGAVVLAGAVMIYARPAGSASWGILVLVFSVVSLVAMGGFFLGAVIGMVGGILALIWSPRAGTPG